MRSALLARGPCAPHSLVVRTSLARGTLQSFPLDDVASDAGSECPSSTPTAASTPTSFDGWDVDGSDASSGHSGTSTSSPAPTPRRAAFSLEPIRRSVQSFLKDRQTASVRLEAVYDLPPDTLFDLLSNPALHAQIFDAIESASSKLVESDGRRAKWQLDYHARWSFWKVSGVCHNRLWMWTDRDAGTVTFRLREPGFLRQYEGTWTILPACGAPMAACYQPSSAQHNRAAAAATARQAPKALAFGPALPPVASVSLAGDGLVSRAVRAIANMQAFTGLPLLPAPGSGALLGKGSPSDGAAHEERIPVARPTQSLVRVDTLSSPKISPPFPINQVLKSQVSTQTTEMVDGLIKAAALQLQATPLMV